MLEFFLCGERHLNRMTGKSATENPELRPYHDMVSRFSLILEVSADDLLGLKEYKKTENKPSSKLLRRLKKIEQLPAYQQKVLLNTIDTFLKGAEK